MHLTPIEVDPSGRLLGLEVVGCHGALAADATPARKAPVFRDGEGFLVRVVDARGSLLAHGEMPAEVSAERISADRFAADASFPGEGTRLGPWPARSGWVVAAIGRRELAAIERLRDQEGAAQESPRVAGLLTAVAAGQGLAELGAQRLGDVVAWYCSLAELHSLKSRCRRLAYDALISACRAEDGSRIQAASYWLGRAWTADDDIARAAAGLERACAAEHRVETMLGRLRGSPAERAAALAVARAWLARTVQASRAEDARPRRRATGVLARAREEARSRATIAASRAWPEVA